MILKVHLQGAASYDVGDEIWQESLADAIHAEAETIAGHAGAELLESPDQAHRDALRDWIVDEMIEVLVKVGDTYLAPDGVRYSLCGEEELDPPGGEGRLRDVAAVEPSPTVVEVLRFDDLPLGSMATRRAVVRWSDGSEGEAIRFYGDEVLICEGDLIDKTREEIRSLHFRRDRDWLQS